MVRHRLMRNIELRGPWSTIGMPSAQIHSRTTATAVNSSHFLSSFSSFAFCSSTCNKATGK